MRTIEARVAVAVAVMAVSVPAMAQDASSVEKCSRKSGTITVVDPRSGLGGLQRVGLGSPSTLLRTMIRQSGCFDVVERGVELQSLQQERALAQSGQLMSESNVGQGQRQVANFVMTPDVQLAASNTGGVLGALGGYTSTPEGKVVAASFLDNFNKVVVQIRDKPSLIQTGRAESQANAQVSTKAEAPQQAGQMLMPRIANVKAYAEPSREAAVVATLQKGDELIASGEVKNGFVKVDSANFSGWMQRTLVSPGGR